MKEIILDICIGTVGLVVSIVLAIIGAWLVVWIGALAVHFLPMPSF